MLYTTTRLGSLPYILKKAAVIATVPEQAQLLRGFGIKLSEEKAAPTCCSQAHPCTSPNRRHKWWRF